ncbi:MAG: DUF3883 domain-containing protein [Terrimicrobiaceae bacterium]
MERAAMEAVRRAEEARGCRVVDVSADKCGWDLTSYPPAIDGKMPEPRHIEVKGRLKGAGTVCVTRNEMLYAFNQGDKFVLAIALVGEGDEVEGPHSPAQLLSRDRSLCLRGIRGHPFRTARGGDYGPRAAAFRGDGKG